MRNRRGCLLMALGLVLAVGTGSLVYYLLQQTPAPQTPATTQRPTATPLPATMRIPVAARELSAGTAITGTDFVVQPFPENLVPSGVLTRTSDLMGQVVVEPIQQGEPFRAAQFGAGPGSVGLDLEPGKVAMAFTRQDLLNRTGVIREGDRIDLLLTMQIEEETATETRAGNATNYTVQNIRVLRIVESTATRNNNQRPAPIAVLFEMTPQDAVIAKFIKDGGGTIDFTVRSARDEERFASEMVNQDFMLDNFGFRAPVSSTRPKQQPAQ